MPICEASWHVSIIFPSRKSMFNFVSHFLHLIWVHACGFVGVCSNDKLCEDVDKLSSWIPFHFHEYLIE